MVAPHSARRALHWVNNKNLALQTVDLIKTTSEKKHCTDFTRKNMQLTLHVNLLQHQRTLLSCLMGLLRDKAMIVQG